MRKIIHVDMDCFFAAVEMRDNPALRDIPIAIGGSRERRGVISTANYPARKFGVRSAMPTGMALKLCPHLTLLPGRYEAYKEASRQIQAIFSRYTSLIEPLSLDEAYLDVTDSTHCHGSATLIAQEIRQTIFCRATVNRLCRNCAGQISGKNSLRSQQTQWAICDYPCRCS
ncbi:DNA polymerase IV [Citrobacter freundii]|uniref:DNA-directed DNA polymerase n=1 Tax=Citrobacter freundii TaxID=546 RepID=A0A7G2IUP5_CITFR|nr:DNA polymerase IV [Citrobacter freundii]